MGWEAVGWQQKARAGSPGIPGIDPYPPPGPEQGCCAVGSREPRPRAREGRQVGEGVRRCAHPSRLSTWQLQFAWPSLTLHLPGACCGAQLRPTCGRGPPVGASGSPAHAPAADWGPQGPRSWTSGTQEGAQPWSSLWSWWAGPGEGGALPRAAPLSLGLAERVSLSRKWGSGSLQNTIRRGMRGGPPDPPGGAARAAGEGAVTQPPSARLPGTLQQLEPPLLQERKAFVPQCQGCQGKREAGRLPLPGGTQDTTLPRGLPAQNGLMVPSPLSPFTKPVTPKPGFSNSWGP